MGDPVGDVVRPSGVVTFLFTDVEGSTRRWEADPDGMREALAAHDETLRSSIEEHDGWMFKHTGDGVCAAFESPGAAVEAAVAAQQDLGLPVRMGIATGEAELRGDDYFGPTLNRAARVMDAGHGGQILVASVAASLVDQVDLLDLGRRRLRDLSEPENLYQVRSEGLRWDFPSLRTLDATPGNLRPQSTSFVGRHEELSEVAAAVRHHRMVTLTGVGGVGKTRLAFQAAAELAPEFADGVWVFELAEVGDPAAVPDAVATEMGILQQAGHSMTESVAIALTGRSRLLVFDNCEHVLDAAADLIEAIFACSETVRIIATSREGLGIGHEHLWPVPSLDVSAEADSEGVALFTNRAAALVPGFSLEDPDDALTVVEICQRLDGIPLAIELAASRMVSMSPVDVRDRLDDRFRLLSGSRRGLERHQTLRHAVQWSYDLLDSDEQSLLRSCSVFAGDFDLDAATTVGGAEDLDEYAVLDRLDALVRKSLLAVETTSGTARYSMLETIRQFAEDDLASTGEAHETRNAHARYFAGRMMVMHDAWDGPDQRDVYDQFLASFANLRSAFRWSIDIGDLDSAASIAMAASRVGYYIEVFEPPGWAEEVLPAARADGHRELLGLYTSAALCCISGRMDKATEYSDAGRLLLGDPAYDHSLGWALAALLMPYAYAGRLDDYLDIARQGVEVGADHVSCPARYLVTPLALSGHTEEALVLTDEMLADARARGNPYDEAQGLLAAAFASREKFPIEALEMSRRGVEIAHSSGNRMTESHLSQMLAQLEAQHGDPESALDSAEKAIERTYDSGNFINFLAAVGILAVVLDVVGHAKAAATIAGAVASDGAARAAWPAIHQTGERLRNDLGYEAFSALAKAGAAMTLAELVAYARAAIGKARDDLGGDDTTSDEIRLTARQLEVAQLVARGLTNKAIAEKLDISPYTVETHVRNILERLDATNRTQIVAWVMANAE